MSNLSPIKTVKINLDEIGLSKTDLVLSFYKDGSEIFYTEKIELGSVTVNLLGTYFSSNSELFNQIVKELTIIRERDENKSLSYCLNNDDPSDMHIILIFTYRKDKGTFQMIMTNVACGNSVDVELATFSYPNHLKRFIETVVDTITQTRLQLTPLNWHQYNT